MSKCATEPVMWDTWMRGLTDWQGMMTAMTKLANPVVFMNWMMAPMNPATYQPMMQMMNPAWYGRWMTAMMNPTFHQPIFFLADPNWYAPRFAWMMNPRSFQPLQSAFAVLSHPVPPSTQTPEERPHAGPDSAPASGTAAAPTAHHPPTRAAANPAPTPRCG